MTEPVLTVDITAEANGPDQYCRIVTVRATLGAVTYALREGIPPWQNAAHVVDQVARRLGPKVIARVRQYAHVAALAIDAADHVAAKETPP